jgi:hypothetical protein
MLLPSRFLYCVQHAQFTTTTADDNYKRPHNPYAIKENKFEAFNKPDGIERDYTVRDEWKRRMNSTGDRFQPKKEMVRSAFDENIRQRMDDIHNDIIYRAFSYERIKPEPQSCYVAIQHAGKTYHLFNAKRFPLGRMAKLCSEYMRGKHKPIYDSSKGDQGDVCIIVNAKELKTTGQKKDQKLYRHHT